MSPSTEARESRRLAREIKFLLPASLAGQVRDWARGRFGSDPHGSGETGDLYQVTSLYFDTPQLDVFHRKGSYGRSKYRIRRYGATDAVFLERKMKTKELVSKRRSLVDVHCLPRLDDLAPERDWEGYWFHRRLLARNLEPVCQIAYSRTARVSMTGYGPVRLTLDTDLRAVPAPGFSFLPSEAALPLLPDQVILELKYMQEMPAMFKHLIEDFRLSRRALSKYRLAVQVLKCVESPGVAPPRYAEQVHA